MRRQTTAIVRQAPVLEKPESETVPCHRPPSAAMTARARVRSTHDTGTMGIDTSSQVRCPTHAPAAARGARSPASHLLPAHLPPQLVPFPPPLAHRTLCASVIHSSIAHAIFCT